MADALEKLKVFLGEVTGQPSGTYKTRQKQIDEATGDNGAPAPVGDTQEAAGQKRPSQSKKWNE